MICASRVATSWLALVGLSVLPAGLEAQSGRVPMGGEWFHIPALFPKGARMTLVEGDPVTPGKLVALIAMPDGYRMAPHSHTFDEHVEVKEGTLLVGVGNKVDPKTTVALVAGDTGTAPAGAPHFAIAKGPTVIQVTTTAPYVVNYARTAEEPWRPFPYGY